MSSTVKSIRQNLTYHINQLPEYRLQEVLDFVQFLIFKDENSPNETSLSSNKPEKQRIQQQALANSSHLREKIAKQHGIYQGDLIAEARAERSKQTDLILGLDK